MVGMNTLSKESFRVRNKNKGKRKKNKQADSAIALRNLLMNNLA